MKTLIRNANVFNTWLKQFFPGWILIDDGRVRYAFVDGECTEQADEVIDAEGCFCIPSLIDIHLHIESSMTTPRNFSKELIKNGVGTCVAEPHEIANVMGIDGVREFIRQGKDCQCDIFWGIPSSVPCSPFETTGGKIELADALELTRDSSVACLGEVMNCFSVLHEPDGKIRQWLEVLRREHPNLTREGHISYYKGRDLCDIAYHGIDSDHTSVGLEYFTERLKMGVFCELQNKSLTQDVIDYIEGINLWEHFSIVTDDVMPDTLVKTGHLNRLVKKAVSMGMKPERAIIAATWNPAQRMKFYDRGIIAPGKIADMVLVDNLKDFNIRRVFKNGKTAWQAGKNENAETVSRYFPNNFYNTVNLPVLTEKDFTIHTSLPDGRHTARTMVPDAASGHIKESTAQVDVKNGQVDYSSTDYCLIAVFDRYTGKANRMLGLIGGSDFITHGAVACTYAHDHHNLLVAGKTPAECAKAANWVIENQGGYCVVDGEKFLAQLRLEVGGIVSEAPLEQVASKAEKVTSSLIELGYKFPNPIMSFSVLSLSVSPFLRITDRGYVDTKNGRLLPLFDEEENQ